MVAESAAGETEPPADKVLEAEVKLDTGVAVAGHDRLVVFETSQCRIAKYLPSLDGWHSRYANFDFGPPAAMLLLAASIAFARRSITCAGVADERIVPALVSTFARKVWLKV